MTRPRSPVQQHIARYLKRNLLLALGCSVPIIALFAVVGVIYKSNAADIWTAIGLTFALAAMFYFAGSARLHSLLYG